MTINQELLAKVKQGTHCMKMPTHPNEESYKILEKIRNEYFPYDGTNTENAVNFYKIISRQKKHDDKFAFWSFPMRDEYFNKMIPIELHSFIVQEEMVKVSEVMEWIDANTFKTFNENVVARDELKQFLTSKKK